MRRAVRRARAERPDVERSTAVYEARRGFGVWLGEADAAFEAGQLQVNLITRAQQLRDGDPGPGDRRLLTFTTARRAPERSCTSAESGTRSALRCGAGGNTGSWLGIDRSIFGPRLGCAVSLSDCG